MATSHCFPVRFYFLSFILSHQFAWFVKRRCRWLKVLNASDYERVFNSQGNSKNEKECLVEELDQQLDLFIDEKNGDSADKDKTDSADQDKTETEEKKDEEQKSEFSSVGLKS